MPFNRFFNPDYAPIYVPILLSFAGTLFYLHGDRLHLLALLSDRWSLHYLLAAPFIHTSAIHFLLNAMLLHYVGGCMLLPILGKRYFLLLLAIGAVAGSLLNNLLATQPAVGISGALMAVLGCALFPYGRAPMKLLFIHDLLRLPPFQYRYLLAAVACIDICGILFGWHFFAHWAHLGGLVSGLLFGELRFRRRWF